MDKRKIPVRDIDCYYTKYEVQEFVLERSRSLIEKIVGDNDTALYVDFSAGKNVFATMLNDRFGIPYKSFDILPGAGDVYQGNVVKGDWLKIKCEDIFDGDKPSVIIMGLNPPFGYQARTAKKFIDHGINIMSPDYCFLILPYMGDDSKWLPTGYKLVQKLQLPKFSFYDSRSGDNKEKDVPTNFIILEKTTDNIIVLQRHDIEIPGLVMKRPGKVDRENLPCIAIRRAGVNSGRQIYIITRNNKTHYISEKGDFYRDVDWTISTDYKRVHAVESKAESTWWKLYFDKERFPLNLIENDEKLLYMLSRFMSENTMKKIPKEMIQPTLNTRNIKETIIEFIEFTQRG